MERSLQIELEYGQGATHPHTTRCFVMIRQNRNNVIFHNRPLHSFSSNPATINSLCTTGKKVKSSNLPLENFLLLVTFSENFLLRYSQWHVGNEKLNVSSPVCYCCQPHCNGAGIEKKIWISATEESISSGNTRILSFLQWPCEELSLVHMSASN